MRHSYIFLCALHTPLRIQTSFSHFHATTEVIELRLIDRLQVNGFSKFITIFMEDEEDHCGVDVKLCDKLFQIVFSVSVG